MDVEIMLDSGSSVSLICQNSITTGMQDVVKVQRTNNFGQALQVAGHIKAPVTVGNLRLTHTFVVVNHLITQAILGVDFLHRQMA